jgi:hypothetical protein
VPLDAKGKVLAQHLDGFDRAVGRKTHGLHPLAKPVNSLVVTAQPSDLGPQDVGDGTTGAKHDAGPGFLAPYDPMVIVAQHVREVLVERTAQDHIHYLQASADTQQREVTAQGGATKRHLPGITNVARRVRLVVGRGPVSTWVEVSTPGDNQAVQAAQQSLWSAQ